MSVFHRLLLGNGTKPFKLVSWPTVMPAHVPDWENAGWQQAKITKAVTMTVLMGPPLRLSQTDSWQAGTSSIVLHAVPTARQKAYSGAAEESKIACKLRYRTPAPSRIFASAAIPNGSYSMEAHPAPCPESRSGLRIGRIA